MPAGGGGTGPDPAPTPPVPPPPARVVKAGRAAPKPPFFPPKPQPRAGSAGWGRRGGSWTPPQTPRPPPRIKAHFAPRGHRRHFGGGDTGLGPGCRRASMGQTGTNWDKLGQTGTTGSSCPLPSDGSTDGSSSVTPTPKPPPPGPQNNGGGGAASPCPRRLLAAGRVSIGKLSSISPKKQKGGGQGRGGDTAPGCCHGFGGGGHQKPDGKTPLELGAAGWGWHLGPGGPPRAGGGGNKSTLKLTKSCFLLIFCSFQYRGGGRGGPRGAGGAS